MTFSIVARCQKTSALGVAVATAIPNVRERVPHVKAGVGAIATQAETNIFYGIKGLEMLENGLSPQAALETMLKEDAGRERRQVAIMDFHGRTAVFTGKNTVAYKGHIVGENFIVLGNMLTGESVILRMVEFFKNSHGSLAERLIATLEVGDSAGGDKRGKCSAALVVVGGENVESSFCVDFRVDFHSDPLKELRRIFEECKRNV